MGLLNMEDSDSETEDSDDTIQRKPNSPPGLVSGSPSKHAVLAAILSPTRSNFPPVPVQQQLPTSQAPSSQPSVTVQVPSQIHDPLLPSLQSAPNHHVPQPIAAPRPGYAAPIAALNLARTELNATPVGRMPNPNSPQPPIAALNFARAEPNGRVPNPNLPLPAPIAALNLARAEPSATPVGRMPNPNSPLPHIDNPFEPRYHQPRSQYPMSASPAPSTPHPLHPSVTPITPAFIRPSKSPALRNEDAINVKFVEGEAIPRKPIMRGNSEETLLPGRGEKGDDFWRRFSMVAKEGSERKER
jgi:hypothetical protein